LSQPTEPRYLRTAQVAELLQVSPKTVSRWAQEGMLPYVRTLGGHRRYPDRESESFWKPCPSHPRPANRTSRLTAPPSLLSMASVALLDHLRSMGSRRRRLGHWLFRGGNVERVGLGKYQAGGHHGRRSSPEDGTSVQFQLR